MRGLLIGEDASIAEWAFRTYNFTPTQFNRALGIVDPLNGLVGAILLQCYNGTDIQLSYYGKNTLTPGIVRAIAAIVVKEFKVSRLTVITSKRNRRFLRAILRLGFKLEGVQHRFYGDRDSIRNTGVRVVMFRERISEIAKLPSEEIHARHTAP